MSLDPNRPVLSPVLLAVVCTVGTIGVFSIVFKGLEFFVRVLEFFVQVLGPGPASAAAIGAMFLIFWCHLSKSDQWKDLPSTSPTDSPKSDP